METKSRTTQDDLFYESLVHSYVDAPRFVERSWLERRVFDALEEPNCRFVLLTAEPGAGKTAFMAWLADEHPNWPRYFIRRDQRTPLDDVGAHSFLLRIGYQLAASYPHLFTQEQVQLVVEQRLGSVAESGRVVGAEVSRLLASPFYQKVLQIQQHVERTAGEVTGLKINELVLDPRLLSLDDLQHMALFDPARALRAADPDARIVVLVDALDEVRYHGVKGSLLEWLTHCPAVPSNVRFVLTSRPPDGTLKLFRDRQQPFLQPLTIEAEDEPVQREMWAYARSLAEEPGVAPILKETKPGADGFVEDAVAKAEGNIGYLDALGRGVDQALANDDQEGLRKLLTLQELPKHIEGLYAFFMRQIKESVQEQGVRVQDPDTGRSYILSVWDEVYRPVLGVLAVAREPLLLDRLGQFLDRPDGRCRLYHATLPEFLTAEATREDPETQDLAIQPAIWHRRIVACYRRGATAWQEVPWSEVDDYGLRHLGAHLYTLRGGNGYTPQLHALVQTPQFGQAQLDRWHTPNATLSDLRLALDVALAEDDLAQAWKHIRRYREILHQEQATQRVAERVKEGDYETALELTDFYGYVPGSQALMRLWIAWKALADDQLQVATTAARRALDGLPPREYLVRRLEEADPEVGGAVSDSMNALTEAFVRLLIRVTRSAASTKEARRAWLENVAGVWPKSMMQAVVGRLYEPFSAWGDILSEHRDARPMDALLEDLKDEIRSADQPANFRDASFRYHRTLGAGLFFSRDEDQWQEYVRRTVKLVSLDDYPSYREMALAWVAAAVLGHRKKEKAMDALLTTLSGALDKPEPGFWGDTMAVALGGWAEESGYGINANDLFRRLEEIEVEQLQKVDPTLPIKPPELRAWRQEVGLPPDPWAHDMRRRSAVGAVLHRRGRTVEAEVQLDMAASQHEWESYAGYRALARPSLACRWLEWDRWDRAAEQLASARVDAEHMLDKVLSQERMDLIDALEGWLSEPGDPLQGPEDEEAALRRVQDFTGMARSLYVQYLSAVWYPDADRLKRLVPLALEDATATDAVLGRLVGALGLQAREGTPFADLVAAMGL